MNGSAVDASRLIGSSVQNATWSARVDGDIAIRLGVVAQEDVECRWQWGAWGVSQDFRPTAGHVVHGHDGPTSTTVQRSQTSLTNVSAHIGAGDNSVEQALQAPYPWATGTNRMYDLTAGQEAHFTFFAIGLTASNASAPMKRHYFPSGFEEANVFMQLACDQSVQVTALGAGKNVVVFDETSFRGGATVHVFGGLETTGASAASHVSADLSTEHGFMLVEVWGDLLLVHASAGVIETEYPGGGDVLVDHPAAGVSCVLQPADCPLAKYYESGPGSYRVIATYASVDQTGILRGAIVGFDSVDRLPLQRMG